MTDDGTDETPPKGACLHCNAEHNKIQVHCDSCGGFICAECHWCHEANHEIRVCDRCDSFFCKDCDEMDQCDDCGEVVCTSCCSLLSCKFCGGGLCEGCAVACGRCGIVLCARDAKFAVECDTCKLSYCLVCLASARKEPCIRCGHRPSKRMEQLVHLRLKSIYKAFQQSARTSDKHVLLKRAALAAQRKPLRPKIDPAIQQAQADAAAASLLKELEEEEEAEAKKQNAKKKKKRKKKKNEDYAEEEGTKEETKPDTNHDEEEPDENSVLPVEDEPAMSRTTLSHNHSPNLKNNSAKSQNLTLEKREVVAVMHKNPSILKRGSLLSTQFRCPVAKKYSDPAVNQSPSRGMKLRGPTIRHIQYIEERGPGASKQQYQSLEKRGSQAHLDFLIKQPPLMEECSNPAPRVPTSALQQNCVEPESKTAALQEPKLSQIEELEVHLLSLVTSGDIDGIENLLDEWKGVPGRAVLRKNAKKARKKLMEEREDKMKPLLKVVSSNTKSKTFELVLEMAPSVVGWVIGKGGVKIRDVMDDSGAKVWIDQESMQNHEPRIVYVSGSKHCVEVAVQMLQQMVDDAPINGTEQLNEESGRDPLLLTEESANSKDSGKSYIIEHKMTCDAGFVPLLIGKRGWTIKNIQDSSGAKVDIDQNVTPRMVTITGKPESVQTAIRLVQDVLSYPQGQLQRKEEDEEILEVDFHIGSHSPPPSSLIMMSTTSVTSSLSSTPEPSVASSKHQRSPNDLTHQHQHQPYLDQNPQIFENRVDSFSGKAMAGQNQRQRHDFQHAHFSVQHLQQEFVNPLMGYHQHMESSCVSGMAPPGLGDSFSPYGYMLHHAVPQSMQLSLPRHLVPPSRITNHYDQLQHKQQVIFSQRNHGTSNDHALASPVNQIGQNYQEAQNLPQLHHAGIWEGHGNSAASFGASILFSKQPHIYQQLPPGSSVQSNLPQNRGGMIGSTQDDSNLVDAMFGPSGSESHLLDDFQGMNMNRWGENAISEKWIDETSNSRLVLEQNQPSESRFNWEKSAG